MLIELNWFWTACVPFSIFEMAPQIEKRDWFSLRSLFGSPAGRIHPVSRGRPDQMSAVERANGRPLKGVDVPSGRTATYCPRHELKNRICNIK